jgi:hypothetical protein
MISKIFPLAIGMVSVLVTTGALAQQNQKKSESMMSLLTAGYEVKNVVFVPMDAMKPMGYPENTAPQVIVTLQKGASAAACSFAATNWQSQVPVTLENPDLCFAYNFK